MPQIVFLSLFLGLVTGFQNVSLRVDDGVKSVRIELGGREVARITSAPWSARVDFGTALTPRELTAIAYDADGREITRIAQVINLARPAAELEIVIRRDGQRPVEAELVGRRRNEPLIVVMRPEQPVRVEPARCPTDDGQCAQHERHRG